MPRDCAALEPFLHDFLTLKKLRRTGWQLRGLRTGESLADHCFGVVLLTMVLADQITTHRLDRARAMALATVHELAEARVGDIPFTALKYFPDKGRAEDHAMRDLLEPLGGPGEEYLALFREFEANTTPEARFVRAIDKLEMLVTARDYEHTGMESLGDFWTNTSTFAAFAEFPEIEALARHLAATRDRKTRPQQF
ncbi:MAG: HD family hydrolase [Candidatus Riflebacteria bacterium]|nr:HD family hydrolase [Candidatus Riflebacteria bacterium]